MRCDSALIAVEQIVDCEGLLPTQSSNIEPSLHYGGGGRVKRGSTNSDGQARVPLPPQPVMFPAVRSRSNPNGLAQALSNNSKFRGPPGQ